MNRITRAWSKCRQGSALRAGLVKLHRNYKPGDFLEMGDKVYQVAQDGSFRFAAMTAEFKGNYIDRRGRAIAEQLPLPLSKVSDAGPQTEKQT